MSKNESILIVNKAREAAACAEANCQSSFTNATNAAISATNSQNSANDSADSASEADNYLTQVTNIFNDFDERYLGAKAVAPTVDNQGNPLQEGALYYNSTSNGLFVWNGSVWVSADFNEFTNFTATGTTNARNLVTRFSDVVNVKDFGAVGDGVTDDTAAIQAAIDVQKGPVFLPNGIYLVSSEIVIKDGTGIIGENPFWKRRTGYVYSVDKNTVIKYVGAGGANSCVIRASKKPVGVPGSDFSPPNTDDIVDIQLKNFHVDANGLAEYAFYFYRAGNCGNVVDCITSEKSAKDNVVFLGMFAGYYGTIAAYEAAGRGIVVADDIWDWVGVYSSSEFNCYNFNATFISANNGTSNTFVEYTGFVYPPTSAPTTDNNNCGIYIRAGRGSKFKVSSEGNKGRSLIVSANSSGSGPLYCSCDYFEGNGAGIKIENYGRFSSGITLDMGFLYPSTQSTTLNPENIKIYPNTANDGPGYTDEWIKINRLIGASGYISFNINSDTTKFKIEDSSGGIKYTTRRPEKFGVIGKGYFKGDATLSDIRYIKGDPLIDTFYGDGITANYTLSYAPTNQQQTSVYVNGVRQNAGTQFTITGTTLTFTSGNIPTSGAAISVAYSNMTLTRTGVGIYLVTFNVPQPNFEYSVSVSNVQNAGKSTVAISTKTNNSFEIRTSTVAAPTILSDNGDFIDFTIVR